MGRLSIHGFRKETTSAGQPTNQDTGVCGESREKEGRDVTRSIQKKSNENIEGGPIKHD